MDNTINEKIVKGDYCHPWHATWTMWRGIYQLGFNVVPAAPYRKSPIREYKHLRDRRLTPEEFEEHRATFRHAWSCNMDILTGSTPGMSLVAIEADDEEAIALVQELCPPTPMVVRSRRGFHYYYRHPGTGWIKQIIGHRIDGTLYHLDRKADGNVMVAPGSIHESGHIYDWVTPWTPELIRSVPVFDPSWLPHEEETATRKTINDAFEDYDHDLRCNECPVAIEDRIHRASQYASKTPGTREGEGTASNAALRLAGKVAVGFLLPYEEAVDVLMDRWADKPDQEPVWKEREIAHKVRDAIQHADRYTGSHPGDMLDIDTTEERLERVVGVHSVPGSLKGDPTAEPSFDDYRVTSEPRKPPGKVRFQRWDQLCKIADQQEEDWYVDSYLEFGCLGLFTGLPFSGKSTLVGELVASTARRTLFFGKRVARCPILLLDLENKERILVKRIRCCLENDPGDLQDLLFRVPPEDITLPLTPEWIAATIDQLRGTIGELGHRGLLVIDTFRSAFAGSDGFDEIDPGSMVSLLKPLKDLAKSTGWAVLVLHHNAKHSNNYSGSTAIAGVADYHWNWQSNKETLTAELSFETRDEYQQPLIFKYNTDTKRNDLVGTKKEVKAEKKKTEDDEKKYAFLRLFPDDPQVGISPETVIERCDFAERWVREHLVKYYNEGFLTRVGDGKRGSPFFYSLTRSGCDFLFIHQVTS